MMKQIAYGYWWNCGACGTENAHGLTADEAEEYIRDWEEDNADAVEDGETGEGACDWWYNVTAEENDAHIEAGDTCWSCGAAATKDTRTDKAKWFDSIVENLK